MGTGGWYYTVQEARNDTSNHTWVLLCNTPFEEFKGMLESNYTKVDFRTTHCQPTPVPRVVKIGEPDRDNDTERDGEADDGVDYTEDDQRNTLLLH